jgi:hypothetical protein
MAGTIEKIQTMFKRLLPLCLIMCVTIAFAQKKHIIYYPDGKIHVTYHTKNGLLNGTYSSYYENGQKKAEGSYIDNQRNGTWNVWDEKGTKRAERFFENSYDSKIIAAWDTTGSVCKVKQLSKSKYVTIDPALGYVPYYPLTEKDVAWAKRCWREITNDSAVNKPLFDDNLLYKLLLEGIRINVITAYGDDEFLHALTYDSIKDFENSNVSAYRIKEDFFYNKTMNNSEYRIIGIGPVVKKSGKMKLLFWLYYPDIRGFLAKQKPEASIHDNSTTYESIFFKRYFHSIIYKVSNVYDREIKDYKKGKDILTEAELIEMNVIENEFVFWYK